jgi:alpha-beta hydrolase superfamily lysophospholipase
MGGLVAAHVARKHQDWFHGLILASPAIDVDKGIVLKIQSLLGGPLEALMPWARMVPAVKVEDMSESEEVGDLLCNPARCTLVFLYTAKDLSRYVYGE